MVAGRLVAFEGIDGGGKSTQLACAAAFCRERRPGRPVLELREPGGTSAGEAVRELLLRGAALAPVTELLLYMAARAELYARVVLPELARGTLVLLDRSHYSTEAYQGAGLGLDVELIRRLAQQATAGRAPDRVILLELPPARARERLAERGAADADRIERRDAAYFERVAAAFRDMAAREPGRFRRVDADRDAQAVAADVRAALDDVV